MDISTTFGLVKCFLALVSGSMAFITTSPEDQHIVRKTQDFKILTEGLFVDKSMLISEVPKESVLVTCPPGFGKSVNLDMIRRYFEIPVDNTTGELLELENSENYRLFTNKTLNLKIMNDTKLFKTHFGKFPVIFLNLFMVNKTNYDDVLSDVRKSLSKCFKKYHWLFEGELGKTLSEEDRKFYQVITNWQDAPAEDIYESVTRSLYFLGQVLQQHFKVKAVLLIDNFDSPMRNAILSGDNIIKTRELIDDLLFNVLHQTPNVTEFTFVTGVFSVLRGAQSSRTRIAHYIFLCRHRFAFYYGFSDEEVEIQYFKPLAIESEEIRNVRKTYYGYIRDRTKYITIYAPVDIVCYFYNRIEYHSVELDTFMVRSRMYVNLENIIRDIRIRDILTDLLWFRMQSFPFPSSVTDATLEKLSKVLTETNTSSVRARDDVVLSYLYEHGILAPGPAADFLKVPNDAMRAYIRRFLNQYYLRNRPLEMMNAQFKVITLLTKIVDFPSDIITPAELGEFELHLSSFFRTFEYLSMTHYGTRATENDLKFLLYHVSYRVSKQSKWKYGAVARTDHGLKKRRVDVMLNSYSNIVLFMRLRYSTYPKKGAEFLGGFRPAGKKPMQVKYLDIMVGDGLVVKATSAPSYTLPV